MDFLHYRRIAEGHRRLAASADTTPEADHWALEAERFEELASLAEFDPGEARRRYRPTRAYEGPTETTYGQTVRHQHSLRVF